MPPKPHSSESMLGRLQKGGAGLEGLTLHWIWGAGTEGSCSMLSSREVGWGLTEAGSPTPPQQGTQLLENPAAFSEPPFEMEQE